MCRNTVFYHDHRGQFNHLNAVFTLFKNKKEVSLGEIISYFFITIFKFLFWNQNKV